MEEAYLLQHTVAMVAMEARAEAEETEVMVVQAKKYAKNIRTLPECTTKPE